MGSRSRSKRRRRADSAAAGVDLISDLGDDILLRILELLPDARVVARTGVLSRRWRGLWTRVQALRFDSVSWPDFKIVPRDVDRFIAVVDDALAHRAAQREPAVERLEISLDSRSCSLKSLATPAFLLQAAQEWIQYAARHEMKSLALELSYLRFPSLHESEEHELTLDGLPTSTKLETMHLALGNAVVQLPATALFASLTELSLERMVAYGSGDLLARLVSSACCPRLQKLRLHELWFKRSWKPQELEVEELVLDAGELMELSWEDVRGGEWTALVLRTPNLRVIRMGGWGACAVGALRVSAPRLENLMFLDQPDYIFPSIANCHAWAVSRLS
ncbi:hypothetical protein ACP70R_010304 [Stipagrostis hirtigluma subsp. patula]